jgi:AI-2 transport protein TqsA
MTPASEPAASSENDPRAAVAAPTTNGASGPPAPPGPLSGLPRAVVLLVGGVSAVGIIAGMRAVAWLIGPVFLALIIVIAAHPVQRWLRGRGWPGWVATLALLLVIYVGLLALALVLLVSVGQLATVLPQYTAQFDALIASLQQLLAGLGIGPAQIQAATSSADLGSIVGALGGVL